VLSIFVLFPVLGVEFHLGILQIVHRSLKNYNHDGQKYYECQDGPVLDRVNVSIADGGQSNNQKIEALNKGELLVAVIGLLQHHKLGFLESQKDPRTHKQKAQDVHDNFSVNL